MGQDSLNQIFNLNAFFFFLLTGATWYYHAVYIVVTYFASFTGFEDNILEVISYLQVLEPKIGGNITSFADNLTPRISWSSFCPSLFRGRVECSEVYDSKLSCEVRLWGDRWWNLSSHSHPLKIGQYSSCKMIRIRNKICH